jgi:hypothetical protein
LGSFLGYKKNSPEKRGFPSYFSLFFAVPMFFFFGVNFAKTPFAHTHKQHTAWLVPG